MGDGRKTGPDRMRVYRAALYSAAAFLLGAAGASAWAQARNATPSPRPLPPGLSQSGGTIMMQPIADDVSTDDTHGESVPLPAPERRPNLIHTLSASDHDLYEKAFDAGDRGDWTAARGLADQGRDAIARRIIVWRYLTDPNGGATFGEIANFLRDYPDWPLRHVLFARAEHAMPPTMAPAAVIDWFAGRTPETGIGKVRLGEALIAEGRRDEGRALIRNAWIEDSFEPAEELAVIARHGDILTPEVDKKRLDHLIWRGDLDAARREMSRVGAETRRIAQVRMALRTNPPAGERMAGALPQTLQDNAGLIFDRAKGLQRMGDDAAMPALLVKAPTRQMARIDPKNWWHELSMAARQALKDRSYNVAYQLVSDTGLREGTDFAEAEFMAGWIALRFLHDPTKALAHFRALADGVNRPISLARAHYWEARAYEAKGGTAAAAHQYRLAAKFGQTFYGQLALTRIEPAPRLRLDHSPIASHGGRGNSGSDDLIHAVRVLADLGEERFIRLFAVHAAETRPQAGYIEQLADDLVRMGFRDVAVRVAKTASYDGIDLWSYSHPIIALPGYKGPGAAPEHALVLGLIRQETEFNDDAVSPVGARGIMQLMPDTARRMARLAGLPYRHSKLASDTHYNIELGMTELSTDLAQWSGSYVLAAAAYNAGPANVEKWIAAYGDPRMPGVDPVDWIEQIPFSETRNYVQRVIENTQVYRDRLAGRSEPLQILADLYRPKPPPDLPVLPPEPVMLKPGPVPVPAARPQQAKTGKNTIAEKRTADAAMPDPPAPAVTPKEKPAH